jgi:hypothetical protein
MAKIQRNQTRIQIDGVSKVSGWINVSEKSDGIGERNKSDESGWKKRIKDSGERQKSRLHIDKLTRARTHVIRSPSQLAQITPGTLHIRI